MAARYGSLAEKAARKRYDPDVEHTAWYDARTSDGMPVEVKAAMLNRRDGKEGRFRVFEKYHRRLVAYEAIDRGIRFTRMQSVDAKELSVRFYSAGGYRDSTQAKISVGSLF